MSEKEKSKTGVAVFIQQDKKMKWYRKLWNVITGNKWRNKRWVVLNEIPKYDKPYEEEKENR